MSSVGERSSLEAMLMITKRPRGPDNGGTNARLYSWLEPKVNSRLYLVGVESKIRSDVKNESILLLIDWIDEADGASIDRKTLRQMVNKAVELAKYYYTIGRPRAIQSTGLAEDQYDPSAQTSEQLVNELFKTKLALLIRNELRNRRMTAGAIEALAEGRTQRQAADKLKEERDAMGVPITTKAARNIVSSAVRGTAEALSSLKEDAHSSLE
jgi:hypothetical protein